MGQRNGNKQTTYKWYEKAITYTDADLQRPVETNSVNLKMEATSSFQCQHKLTVHSVRT